MRSTSYGWYGLYICYIACAGCAEEPETAPAAAAEKEEKAKAVEKTLSKKVRLQLCDCRRALPSVHAVGAWSKHLSGLAAEQGDKAFIILIHCCTHVQQ